MSGQSNAGVVWRWLFLALLLLLVVAAAWKAIRLATAAGAVQRDTGALVAATPLAQLGATLVQPFSVAAQEDQPEQGSLARYLAAACSLQPHLPEMERKLGLAAPALERLRGRPLGGPLRLFGSPLEDALRLLPQVHRGLELLGALGPALGMDGPRSYLLLGQNNQEIRATGGFIGSVGAVTVEKGAVVRLDYGSSYAVDAGVVPQSPPTPLARYLGLGGWYLRDANWWPDFPASAAQVEEAWLRAGRGPVDGVVALDSTAIEAVMRAVGGVEVEGYGAVTADSFQMRAAEQLYSRAALASAESFHRAKGEFLGAVGRRPRGQAVQPAP